MFHYSVCIFIIEYWKTHRIYVLCICIYLSLCYMLHLLCYLCYISDITYHLFLYSVLYICTRIVVLHNTCNVIYVFRYMTYYMMCVIYSMLLLHSIFIKYIYIYILCLVLYIFPQPQTQLPKKYYLGINSEPFNYHLD